MLERITEFLASYAETHLATEHNLGMVLASYVMIWAMEPAIKAAIERLPPSSQLTWWAVQKRGKAIAAIVWCSIFVWIPTTQPELCSPGAVEPCQSVVGRIMIGIILGGAMSVAHRYALAPLKRRFGLETKPPAEVTRAK